MKILITGGLGFVGSTLAKKCVSLGHDVAILSNTNTKIKNIKSIKDKVNVCYKDVVSIGKEVKGMDRIFHCASTVDNYNIHDQPFLDSTVNVMGTNALMEACRNHNPKVTVVYLSTFFVNGDPPYLPADPEMKTDPLGLYGATKLCGEHICKTYNRVFGIPIKIVRPTNVFGPYEQGGNNKKAAFNRMIQLAVNDGTITLYNGGEVKRDYIYIDDVIDGIMTVSDKGKIGEIYYIGNGKGVSLLDLVMMILRAAKSGKITNIDPPEFHNQVGVGDFHCDNSTLKELGWYPKVGYVEGIERTVKFYESRNK